MLRSVVWAVVRPGEPEEVPDPGMEAQRRLQQRLKDGEGRVS